MNEGSKDTPPPKELPKGIIDFNKKLENSISGIDWYIGLDQIVCSFPDRNLQNLFRPDLRQMMEMTLKDPESPEIRSMADRIRNRLQSLYGIPVTGQDIVNAVDTANREVEEMMNDEEKREEKRRSKLSEFERKAEDQKEEQQSRKDLEEISRRTGLSKEELQQRARGWLDYFQPAEERWQDKHQAAGNKTIPFKPKSKKNT